MTNAQIHKLTSMRIEGIGSTAIAKTLGVSVNTVRSYIKRHPLTTNANHTCKQCGKPITCIAGKKARQFCSDRCRSQWWNEHRHLSSHRNQITCTCKYCGKEFRDYEKSDRKYCSRKCYHESLRKANSI